MRECRQYPPLHCGRWATSFDFEKTGDWTSLVQDSPMAESEVSIVLSALSIDRNDRRKIRRYFSLVNGIFHPKLDLLEHCAKQFG